MIDEDRLAALAIELAQRVRTGDPEDNADWLAASTTEADRWRLLFALAAAAPSTEQGYRRSKYWAAKIADEAPEILDDIAIERACRGEPVTLTRAERVAAIRRMTRRGQSVAVIAERLNVCRRLVQRARSGEMQWAEEVA